MVMMINNKKHRNIEMEPHKVKNKTSMKNEAFIYCVAVKRDNTLETGR